MVITCKICKKLLDIQNDYVFFPIGYWENKNNIFTHGECWAEISKLSAKKKKIILS